MTGGVHQFVPMLHVGDAVGHHTTALQALLRRRGVDSHVFVELVDPETEHCTRLAETYDEVAQPDDVLVYQFATPSDLAPWLARRAERLVVNYHNITPPECLAPWDNLLARRHVAARFELAQLAGRAVLGVADSEYNRTDLVEAGFSTCRVVPPVVPLASDGGGDPGPVRHDAAAAVADRRTGSRWLTVGRLAPNKALEQVVAALLVYRAHHDPAAALHVVGRPVLAPYAAALQAYVAELGLADAVSFSGRVDDTTLRDAYRSSDVLVVASEHEGFCLPIVEAMTCGVPVVARRRGAVPEVVGEAGVLVDEPGPFALSEGVARVVGAPELRRELVRAGMQRVDHLGLADAGDRLVELLLAVRRADQLPLEPTPVEDEPAR